MLNIKINALLIIISFLGSQWVWGAEQAIELLNAYAQTQETFSKYILKYEAKREYHNDMIAQYDHLNGHPIHYFAGEVRRDGNRYCSRVNHWGNVLNASEAQPQDKPQYESVLFDGSMKLQYTDNKSSRHRPKGFGFLNQKDDPDYVEATLNEKLFWSEDRILLGCLYDDFVRVDEILKKASSLTVSRDEGDLAGCYLITGKTTIGVYKIWLDPEHDYHIARAELTRRAGDRYSFSKPNPLPENFKLDFVLGNVKFKKFEVGWLPIYAICESHVETPHGLTDMTEEIRRVEVKVNPDFDALQSFVPDDIPDGAPIKKTGNPIPYIWHEGKITPNIMSLMEKAEN